MTASEILDKVLPRWRATLPPRYSPDFVDGFIARNRPALEALVAQAMTIRRLRRGALPRTVEEFSAFGLLAERERKHDAATDAEVLRRVKKWMDKMLEGAADEEGRARVTGMQAEYALLRAEALLLRQRGWDAVPLLLRRPALAIYSAKSVVMVHRHDPEPEEAVFPGLEASSVVELRADAEAAHEQATAVRAQIPGTRPERIAMALWARARGSAPMKKSASTTERAPAEESAPASAAAPVELDVPPDHRTKAWRTDANLRAMNLVVKKKPGEFSAEELAVLAQYSGWGGLSIEEIERDLPASLRPESFGLIHEYYTPTIIAAAIVHVLCPYLPTLAGNDGVLRALEPSAGIGRLIRAFTPKLCLELEADGHVKRIDWTAVEFSKVSSRLLGALRPDVDLYAMPFERFVREEGPAHAGTFGLVVANPPYGERGAMAREDTDDFYKEKRAYAYFMRRALDLLIPGGIGVFLIPAGFLSGNLNRGLREKILRRHHLLGAYRLPSHDARGRETVPGASVVMDVVFWQCRGGELTEVDEADHDILEGTYFEHHRDHILGAEDGSFRGDDEAGMARSWRYKVTGDFTSLPPLTPRPVCTACVLTMIEPEEREAPAYQSVVAGGDEIPEDVDEALVPALELGARVGRYLAAVGQDDERAAQLWPELTGALRDFAEVFGNPNRAADLRALADERKIPAAQRLMGAFTKSGELAPALREPPRIEPKFTGQPDDVVAQAEALYRQQRRLTVDELLAFHDRQGGALDRDGALAALFAAEWNLDGERWDELLPADAYTSGNDLWERHERAKARADQGDEQAKVQARRLLDAIKPAVFEDLADLSPQHGYVPLELVAGWLSETLNSRYGPVALEREGGFVQVQGKDYIDHRERAGVSPETLAFLGYYNHDPALFQPPKDKSDREAPRSREERAQKKQSLAERRIALAKRWSDSFRDWVAADDDRREALVSAYNHVARGRIVPEFSPEPLDIARWGAKAPKLRPHQIAGARRVLSTRGGLLAFDVGVGKTYTALAVIARARQEGWVRRPVILVPGSLVWKWHDDILCTLPDYRVVVIGSNRKRLRRGARKGIVTSETDTPQERAQKWMALQTGQVDVVILSYDALARTRMSDEVVMAYIGQVEAVERSIALRRRSLQEKVKSRKQAEKLSERERALLEHGVKAWVEEILALPANHEYDPGVAWDEIGIDMLVIDEAAAFKNLYKPQPREDGVPKFMGGGGEGSDRAWQLDFRAAAVRQKTGGAGIVLLTATPAKNSPLEFYNLIQFIDPTAFTSAGIRDPEQFIDRFLKIEYREVLDSTFEVTKKSAVTGFKNLDDLRTIIFTYGEFRTAEEVGLKLPRPVVETITIQMDDEQESKYDRYVKQIEEVLENPNPEGSEGNAILGLLARLSLVALHGSLDEGYSYRTALTGGVVRRTVYQDGDAVKVSLTLPRPVYESPKLVECAKRVAASPHCGHIIFCEPTAVHQWMREVLVEHGIGRERIAILNAEETAPADRIRIAREFNGLSSELPAPGSCARPSDSKTAPKYDVVIANSVAYEGIDLQVRTCTIHHLDLPWTPADLEQRNGRAVRQGNTLGIVHIYYYFADGSTDGYRFSLIDGKATWLGELLKSQVRDTNNPAAQQQLSPEDILLMISRNKEKTKALLEEKKRRQIEEARAKIGKEAARILRQAGARFRDARQSADADRAARLREEGEQRLSDLEDVNPDAWPWAPWMYAVREQEALIPEDGGAPVYEGLRIARPRPGAPDQLEFLEFGRIVRDAEGDRIGLRAAGSPSWQLVRYTGAIAGSPITAADLPRDGGPMWPEYDEVRTAEAIEQKLETLRYARFENLAWRGASEAFLERYWPRFAAPIADRLSSSFHRESVPVVDDEGLAIATGSEIGGARILPPTSAGWKEYLELAPRSGESYTTLRDAGLEWWDRKIPQDLLSAAKARDESEVVESAEVESTRMEAATPAPEREPDPTVTTTPASSTTSAKSQAPAPARDARAAAKVLVRRLNLMPQGVRVGSTYFGTPTVEAQDGEVEITFQGPETDGGIPLMILRATPQDGDQVELRGELHDAESRVTARFGPITIQRSELVILRETSLARWFGVETTPDRKLAPTLRSALLRLRAEEDEATDPDEQHVWAGVDEGTKDRLIARGLAIALENPQGGFAHYRLTRKGREAVESVEGEEQAEQAKQAEASSIDDIYDRARSELRALRLPAKQHTKFLRQLDAAITTKKSTAPILARAKKAAEKLSINTAPAIRTPEPSTLDAIVDDFNAAPRWRLALQRPRPGGYVFAVYPEGQDPNDAVASIEVLDFDVDQARWISDRLSRADQDEILARLDRALWVGVDLDEQRSAESRSPIQDLIEAMERRARELGADPQQSLQARRSDGYAAIAEGLRDLSRPVGMAADELERWLESHDFFVAAEVVARSRAGAVHLDTLLGDLWAAVFDHFSIARVQGEPGRLRVPRFAVQGAGDRYVLLAEKDASRPKRIWVVVRGDEGEGSTRVIDDPAGHLRRGSEVFTGDVDEALLGELYKNLSEFEEGLRRAPQTLGDVRTLLFWATAMLDAPRCQGEVKRATLRAIEEARAYYDAARRQLGEGQAVDAVRRMHAALRRIGAAAAELAQSCAEGQVPIPGVEPALEVTPEDAAAIEAPAKTSASASAGAKRSTSGGVTASAAMEVFD